MLAARATEAAHRGGLWATSGRVLGGLYYSTAASAKCFWGELKEAGYTLNKAL